MLCLFQRVIDYRASRGGRGGAISSSSGSGMGDATFSTSGSTSGSTSSRDLGSFPVMIMKVQ